MERWQFTDIVRKEPLSVERRNIQAVSNMQIAHLQSLDHPKLKEAGFTCHNCQSTSDLTVHHDQKRFAEILQEAVTAMGDPGENFERKTEIAEWVADYHQNEQVSGVVLCVECHRKEHAADQSR